MTNLFDLDRGVEYGDYEGGGGGIVMDGMTMVE